MGAQNSSDSKSKLSEIKENYNVQRSINDPRYGEGKILEKKKDKEAQALMKEINISDEDQFKKWQKKLETRQAIHNDNIIKILSSYQVQESQMCSYMFKVYILFEYIPDSLQVRINQKKQENTHFSQDELMTLIKGAINGLSTFQQNNITHQNIRTQTLSVMGSIDQQNLALKVCDTPLLTNMTAFGAVLQDFSAPILVKAVHDLQYEPKHNPYKSDVFSLGMTMLSAALLNPCDMCYLYNVGEINEHEVETMLEKAGQLYSKSIVELLNYMLKFKEEQRPDFIILREYLQNGPQSRLPDPVNTSRAQPMIISKAIPMTMNSDLQVNDAEQQSTIQQQGYNHFAKASPFSDKTETSSKTIQMDVSNILTIDNADQIKTTKPSEKTAQTSTNDVVQTDIVPQLKNNEISRVSQNGTNFYPPQSPIERNKYSPPFKYSPQQDNGQIASNGQKYIPSVQAPISYKSDILQQSSSNQYIQDQYKSSFDTNALSFKGNNSKNENQQSNQYLDAPKSSFNSNQQQIRGNNNQNNYQMNYDQKQSDTDLIAQYEAKYNTKILQRGDQQSVNIQQYQSRTVKAVQSNDSNYQTSTTTYGLLQQEKKYTENFSLISSSVQQKEFTTIRDAPQNNYSQSQAKDYLKYSNKPFEPLEYQIPKINEAPKQNNDYLFSQVITQSNQKYPQEYQLQNNNQYLPNNQIQRPTQKRNGYARVDFPQGGYYEGNFDNDCMSGIGTLYYQSGRPAYEGQWSDDKFKGQGTLYNEFPENANIQIDPRDLSSMESCWNKYIGGFNDDSKNGYGTLYFTNGDKFEGAFQDDQVHGLGNYIKSNGQVIKGLWQNNILKS